MTQISARDWGNIAGKPVSLITLKWENGLIVRLSNYGALLQSVLLPLPGGETLDLVLGYDTLEAYQKGGDFLGACVGPIADRMAGGICELNGQTVRLPQDAYPDAMHSGESGFHRQVWDWEEAEDGVRFTLLMKEGSHPFPGDVKAALTYRLEDENTLSLTYAASGTKEMAFSLTNHSYFNLSGAKEACLHHLLEVEADHYAVTTRTSSPIVTGELGPLAGTPLDFRHRKAVIEAVSRTDDPEIASAKGVDHYFPVLGSGFRKAAEITNPENGLRLTCLTDAEGVFVYTGNFLKGAPGKGGVPYHQNFGICLETEQMPNAVNFREHRHKVIKQPGETYQSRTAFRFTFS